MPKKYIKPSDIEIKKQNGSFSIDIIGGNACYKFSFPATGNPEIYCDEYLVWSPSNLDLWPNWNWEDEAKKAIAKHNNKDIPFLEKIKFHVNLFLSPIPNKLASAIFLAAAIIAIVTFFISC